VIKGILRVELGSGSAQANKSGKAPSGAGKPGAANPSSAASENTTGTENAETYIPAGTFMRGVLLAGLDAPTGGQAQQNPHPVIIEVMDMASLPNRFKADYKNCRFTANGAGDLSSERAYIRLDRLSCISEDGGALDIGVKGYIADQTGKAGVRGRLVSKQGQVLANALVAGVASGIGTAFAQSSTTTSTSALGSTQTIKDGEQLQAGIGTGVGNALQQLSKYYISLAEKMFPIIEVDAGQPVDIVITKGVSVARK
jgi:conjugal transfer pilus assembly protein TraB